MFILASQSPRRRELLSMLGLTFEIVTADIDETMDPSLPVEEAVAQVCARKARAVAERCPGQLIVAADTIVVVEGKVLGKPHSEAEAFSMLRSLSGRSHTVMTAFCLYRDGVCESHVEKTDLRFKPLSDEEILAYIATGSPMDKAGAYGIQDGAAVFVEALQGDYYNVMGLPLCALVKCLRRCGVPVLGTVKP
ncbi:MAG: septum formation protein Maf [Oscillospiraceae bacterium]|nr:septum formation protein Maf [Oscillospiraceae bacterium]